MIKSGLNPQGTNKSQQVESTSTFSGNSVATTTTDTQQRANQLFNHFLSKNPSTRSSAISDFTVQLNDGILTNEHFLNLKNGLINDPLNKIITKSISPSFLKNLDILYEASPYNLRDALCELRKAPLPYPFAFLASLVSQKIIPAGSPQSKHLLSTLLFLYRCIYDSSWNERKREITSLNITKLFEVILDHNLLTTDDVKRPFLEGINAFHTTRNVLRGLLKFSTPQHIIKFLDLFPDDKQEDENMYISLLNELIYWLIDYNKTINGHKVLIEMINTNKPDVDTLTKKTYLIPKCTTYLSEICYSVEAVESSIELLQLLIDKDILKQNSKTFTKLLMSIISDDVLKVVFEGSFSALKTFLESLVKNNKLSKDLQISLYNKLLPYITDTRSQNSEVNTKSRAMELINIIKIP